MRVSPIYFFVGPGVEDGAGIAEGAGDAEAFRATDVADVAEPAGIADVAGAAAMRTLIPVVSESDGLTITLSDWATPLRISD